MAIHSSTLLTTDRALQLTLTRSAAFRFNGDAVQFVFDMLRQCALSSRNGAMSWLLPYIVK